MLGVMLGKLQFKLCQLLDCACCEAKGNASLYRNMCSVCVSKEMTTEGLRKSFSVRCFGEIAAKEI